MKTFRLLLHPPGLQPFLGHCNRKKHSFRLSQLSRESPLSKDCGTQRKHLFRFWLHFPEAQRLSVRSIAKKQPRRLSLHLPESSPQQDFCNPKKRCVRSPLTPSGIVTDRMTARCRKKASVPISVTPAGMAMSPPGPIYLVNILFSMIKSLVWLMVPQCKSLFETPKADYRPNKKDKRKHPCASRPSVD